MAKKMRLGKKSITGYVIDDREKTTTAKSREVTVMQVHENQGVDGGSVSYDVAIHNDRVRENIPEGLQWGDRVTVQGNYLVEPYVDARGETGLQHRLLAEEVAVAAGPPDDAELEVLDQPNFVHRVNEAKRDVPWTVYGFTDEGVPQVTISREELYNDPGLRSYVLDIKSRHDPYFDADDWVDLRDALIEEQQLSGVPAIGDGGLATGDADVDVRMAERIIEVERPAEVNRYIRRQRDRDIYSSMRSHVATTTAEPELFAPLSDRAMWEETKEQIMVEAFVDDPTDSIVRYELIDKMFETYGRESMARLIDEQSMDELFEIGVEKRLHAQQHDAPIDRDHSPAEESVTTRAQASGQEHAAEPEKTHGISAKAARSSRHTPQMDTEHLAAQQLTSLATRPGMNGPSI